MASDPVVLMNNPESLSIDSQGRMRAAGVIISNEHLLRYFYDKLVWNVDLSSWIIRTENKAVEVNIEDTAYVVKSIEGNDGQLELILNDFSREIFKPETLMNDTEGNSAFYCKVKKGQYTAKLLSAAAQTLFPEIEESDGTFLFRGHTVEKIDRENSIS